LTTLQGPRNERGFTLVEVTIILLVLVILSTIMLPQLGNFNRLARFVVVKEDTAALCANLKKFFDEVMISAPYGQPGGTSAKPDLKVGLLFGPGSIPSVSGLGPTFNAPANNTKVWDEPQGSSFVIKPDGAFSMNETFYADSIAQHLQTNQPLAPNGGATVDRYKNALDDPSVGAFFGWRGPYFNQINADPWGTRYSVNVFGLHSTSWTSNTDDIYGTAVICISFGPNKAADTEANMPGPPTAGPSYAIGGDDVAAILSAMGPF
jgi:type II secretory pathway pseudopilin PulG